MAATSQVRSKQDIIIQAGELGIAIAAGLDAIQLAGALGGLFLPPLKRDNEPLEVEDATLPELQDWASDWTPVLDAYDVAHPDPG
jgi:hypothetical protein